MQHFKKYQLTNSFNLPCIVSDIWFPENYFDLKEIFYYNKSTKIVADCTNVICNQYVKKLICLRKMPKGISSFIDKNNNVIVHCTANVKSRIFIQYLLCGSVGGFESLYGLPGTVGGAIVGNAGSGGINISDYLDYILTIDNRGNDYIFYKRELNFLRRRSDIQKLSHIVTDVYFKFPKKTIDFDKLELAKLRRKKFPKYPSAGGIFINWHELKKYEMQLIGLKVGGAEVSEMVNIIINKGDATVNDIVSLITKIQNIVKTPLDLEIKFL
jgi:UDP-N-acetylmuramate dehydrogenase